MSTSLNSSSSTATDPQAQKSIRLQDIVNHSASRLRKALAVLQTKQVLSPEDQEIWRLQLDSPGFNLPPARYIPRFTPDNSQPLVISELVTHLHLDNAFGLLTLANTDMICHLTHLALRIPNAHQTIDSVNACLQSSILEMFVFIMCLPQCSSRTWDGNRWVDSERLSLENRQQLEWARHRRTTDSRMHFVTVVFGNAIRTWKEEVESGESIWETAARQTKEWDMLLE